MLFLLFFEKEPITYSLNLVLYSEALYEVRKNWVFGIAVKDELIKDEVSVYRVTLLLQRGSPVVVAKSSIKTKRR